MQSFAIFTFIHLRFPAKSLSLEVVLHGEIMSNPTINSKWNSNLHNKILLGLPSSPVSTVSTRSNKTSFEMCYGQWTRSACILAARFATEWLVIFQSKKYQGAYLAGHVILSKVCIYINHSIYIYIYTYMVGFTQLSSKTFWEIPCYIWLYNLQWFECPALTIFHQRRILK